MDKREYWLDNLRAVSTFAVICLHVVGILIYNKELPISIWMIGNVYDSLARFCVPVFFMISGSLLLSKDYTLKEFFNKRILKIIPPLIFWSFIYIFIDIFYHSHVVGDVHFTLIQIVKTIIKKLFYGSVGHLWFVYTLLGLYLLTPILRKWVKNSSRGELRYFLIIWLITILYAAPEVKKYLPQIELLNFSGYVGYFVLGYYLTNYESKVKNLDVFLIAIGLLTTILCTYFAFSLGMDYIYFHTFLTYNVLITSAGIFLLFKFREFKSEIVKKVLYPISKYSYGIYLSHVFVLKIFFKIGIDANFINPILAVPIVTLFCAAISFLIIFLGSKIKYLNKIIG
ncbi:MAG: acyltransferase family protein [Paludibacteraceae bacterium]|nr:acyltransferase family protein [Paludibacteraceae bacterium]